MSEEHAERAAGSAVDAGGWSAVGRRPDNQDRWYVDGRLAVVSDGMGGYRGGALAAQLAVEAAVAELGPAADAVCEQRVVAAFERANHAVRAARADDPEVAEMGATLTVAVAVDPEATGDHPDPDLAAPGRRWLVAHVGDSPAFLVTDGIAEPVTVDHTVSAALVATGALTATEASRHPGRHLLTRAIGSDPTVEVEMTEVVVAPGRALVLVSDGVSGSLTADEIGSVVEHHPLAPHAATTLVDRAVEAGASDNVTAVVVRVASSPV